jgi:hypothetical protein
VQGNRKNMSTTELLPPVVTPDPEQPSSNPNKRKPRKGPSKGLVFGLGGGAVTGVALAALLTGGFGLAGNSENAPDETEGTEQVDEPIVDGEPVTNPETSPDTLDTITIEAGQSDQEAALDIQTQLSNWNLAGADGFIDAWTEQVVKTGDASNEAYEAFVEGYVLEQSKPYLTELFGVSSVDEISDQATKDYVNGTMENLEKNLYLILQTKGKYEEETQLTSSSAVAAGEGRTFTLNTEIVSNSAQSGAAGVIRDNGWVDSTGEKAVVTASTWIDSESERISSISIELAN